MYPFVWLGYRSQHRLFFSVLDDRQNLLQFFHRRVIPGLNDENIISIFIFKLPVIKFFPYLLFQKLDHGKTGGLIIQRMGYFISQIHVCADSYKFISILSLTV